MPVNIVLIAAKNNKRIKTREDKNMCLKEKLAKLRGKVCDAAR